MAQVIVNDTSLTAIANAIRAKNGSNITYLPSEMATAIGNLSTGGIEFPSGTVSLNAIANFFSDASADLMTNIWLPIFKNNKIEITTNGVTSVGGMFSNANLSRLSLSDLNYIFPNIYIRDASSINGNSFLTSIIISSEMKNTVEGQTALLKKIKKSTNTSNNNNTVFLVSNLNMIPLVTGFTIPKEWATEPSKRISIHDLVLRFNTTTMNNVFQDANYMLTIFPEVLQEIYNNTLSIAPINFKYCYWLDKIDQLRMVPSVSASNQYGNFLQSNYNLRKIVFYNPNSTLTTNLKNQTITIPTCTGYLYNTLSTEDSRTEESDRLNYYNRNTHNLYYCIRGQHVDNIIVGPTTYAANKNNEYATAIFKDYSLYNHDSAVETINSLPDCTYKENNTMTLHFTAPSAGSATDGGAISDLTAAEIAVATDKGWTVTFGSQ